MLCSYRAPVLRYDMMEQKLHRHKFLFKRDAFLPVPESTRNAFVQNDINGTVQLCIPISKKGIRNYHGNTNDVQMV